MKLIIFCFLAAATASAFVLSPRHAWTKLILTHHWPTTFCGMEQCHSKIDSWTLHGLWPDNGNVCNSTWHFNVSLIEDLLPDMEKVGQIYSVLNPQNFGSMSGTNMEHVLPKLNL
ncbi:hypothetical protein WMY93_013882 [Mugilogobius chulae]|uniref:Uncharacterized protein n=1 Tax=Mugilogobius chulae TaxID=88201 RepID=A0AAW0P195_9GOBI